MESRIFETDDFAGAGASAGGVTGRAIETGGGTTDAGAGVANEAGGAATAVGGGATDAGGAGMDAGDVTTDAGGGGIDAAGGAHVGASNDAGGGGIDAAGADDAGAGTTAAGATSTSNFGTGAGANAPGGVPIFDVAADVKATPLVGAGGMLAARVAGAGGTGVVRACGAGGGVDLMGATAMPRISASSRSSVAARSRAAGSPPWPISAGSEAGAGGVDLDAGGFDVRETGRGIEGRTLALMAFERASCVPFSAGCGCTRKHRMICVVSPCSSGDHEAIPGSQPLTHRPTRRMGYPRNC